MGIMIMFLSMIFYLYMILRKSVIEFREGVKAGKRR